MATLTRGSPYFALAWGSDDQAMADKILEMLAVKPVATVAEIGAGNGAMAVRIAKRLGPGGRVFATEIDPALMESASAPARPTSIM
jgi:tRNA A58 N-methylase Trm61